jgi:hypothetical protein
MKTKVKYSDYFIEKVRVNGEKYAFPKEGSPKELEDLIKSIHGLFDALPHDWIYKTIFWAFYWLEDDITIEPEADVYTRDLLKWLDVALPISLHLCDEALEEGLCEAKDLTSIIACGQWIGLDRIYNEVREFLELKNEEQKESDGN